MRLGIAFHRFGPYHAARLAAAGACGELTGIEYSSRDDTYPWSRVERIGNVRREVCFSDADVAGKSLSEVSARVARVLDEARPDVMAVPGWSSPAAIATLRWCAANKTPAVLMSDSLRPRAPRMWKEWAKSRIVRLFSAALVAGTPHVDYVTSLGMPRERIRVGYDAVDNSYFTARSDRAREDACAERRRLSLPDRYFLAPARFIAEKNIPRLLEAYARYLALAGAASWDLVLLGDGPLRAAIEKRIAELGISRRVVMPGFIQYDGLPSYYGLAGAVVLASVSETWGLVVNESMASGLPVLVSTRCGCAGDLVREQGNGLTFDPFDIDQMARCMLRMSSGELDLAAMGAESRARIADWGLQAFARNLWEAARMACATQSRPPEAMDKVILWAMTQR